MGRDDNGFASGLAGTDCMSLDDRQFLEGAFDPEISSCDHQGVRCLDDFIEVADPLLIFDLCDDLGIRIVFMKKVFQEIDRIGVTGKGESEIVMLAFDSDKRISPVFLSDGRKVCFGPGEIYVASASEGRILEGFANDRTGSFFNCLEWNQSIV